MIALALAALLAGTAPKPLYRDPVQDGAADVSIVRDGPAREWRMFYTNRRAALKGGTDADVRWVHGTKIGVATSRDGARWTYRGTADIPAACTGPTLWAPEIQTFGGVHHMWLTVVPGVFANWNGARRIVHLTSHDLRKWRCADTLDLKSDRVIDASVVALPAGGYRLWYKDERRGSRILYADSPDLIRWTVAGTAVETPGEGPKVFRWKDRWWMVSDTWKGLLVMRSDDLVHWTRQDDRLLEVPGTQPTDRGKGQHPDVVVAGDRAWLFYFVHQDGEPQTKHDPRWRRRTVIQVAELRAADGRLTVDRAAPVVVDLNRQATRGDNLTSASRASKMTGITSFRPTGYKTTP